MATERLRSDICGSLVQVARSLRPGDSRRYKAAAFIRGISMAVERTLSIIKPDATRRNLTGEILARFEKAGLRVVAQKRLRLSRPQAEAFYAVHRERPFFKGLVEFM